MIEKAYSPAEVEKKWVAAWKEAGLFRARPEGDPKQAYTIVIPPPNVTGALHIGHALNNTLQDVLIRYHRLLGRRVCWVPGTDHGGIATQNVMEKQLKAEGKSRHDIGREAFLQRMHEWTRSCQDTILGQLRRLGCALDWDRTAFTMDSERAGAVFHAFQSLWEKDLVYRGKRMVNWCVRCHTALSDIEVEYEERKGKLWHIRYPVAGQPGRSLVVATTRPETLFGDAAVAVNPADARYKDLVGKKLLLPLTGREIPVIADPHVDASFGTGALKVTPNHDVNDYEIWLRHKDAVERPKDHVIGYDGKVSKNEYTGRYGGLSREKARDEAVADLEAQGLLEKAEDHRNSVGTCYRCQQVIEPLLSEQWFMKMEDLASSAREALEKEAFRIYPDSWEGPYRGWLDGIRDWCLSRQIWWGHRIPVWYCADCTDERLVAVLPDGEGGARTGSVKKLLAEGVPWELIEGGRYNYALKLDESVLQFPQPGVVVQDRKPAACKDCRGDRWLQDQDVLDTWFSSALWPLSVFGWPKATPDLKFFYPTKVLVTGYEILYLWVARMQMMGLRFTGKVPFPDALIHGIVRDKAGKKMSKSLGNVIDPLTMMDAHGTDAFRFSLVRQAYPGRDIPYAEDSITGPRNFANKLWNSTRFVLMNIPEKRVQGRGPAVVAGGSVAEAGWELADYWIVSEFNRMRAEVQGRMERYELAAAADAIYAFLWDKYCDWYIELAKLRLTGPDGAGKDAVREILVGVLASTLKLLHPFMPYITEELYQELKPYTGEKAAFILESQLPMTPGDHLYGVDPAPMGPLMEAVSAIRAMRSQLNVPPGLKVRALYERTDPERAETVVRHRAYLTHLASLESFEPLPNGRPAQSAAAVAGGLTMYVPLAGIVKDFEKERARLAKQSQQKAAELARGEAQLSNPQFMERAPADQVDKLRRQVADLRREIQSLDDILRSLA